MSFNRTAMPTGADLINFLVSTGLITRPLAGNPALVLYDAFADAASKEFSQATGYDPFAVIPQPEGSDVAEVRIYTPQGTERGRPGWWSGYGGYGGAYGGGPYLSLGGGAVAVNIVRVGIDPYLGPSSGQVLVLNQDYVLYPADAPQRNRPWTAIEWLGGYRRGGLNSIQVTARFGYGKAGGMDPFYVPANAWMAVLMRGAALASGNVDLQITGGLSSFTEADVTEKYNPSPTASQMAMWNKEFQRAVSAYTVLI